MPPSIWECRRRLLVSPSLSSPVDVTAAPSFGHHRQPSSIVGVVRRRRCRWLFAVAVVPLVAELPFPTALLSNCRRNRGCFTHRRRREGGLDPSPKLLSLLGNDDALMTIGRLQTKQRVETPTMSDEGSD
ncbi:hypothetical protein LINPERHAP2_LOCUS19383 [Linum perenne]